MRSRPRAAHDAGITKEGIMVQRVGSMSSDAGLSARFSGQVLTPLSPGYDEARRVWNAGIDKRPALVLRPRVTADVVLAVEHARQRDLPIAVRCGGHSVAGHSACDGGLLIDLSLMKGVRVDPDRLRARAAGGVVWGEYDSATQAYGLASPGGRVTTTGIGGFTLGGGYGWLSPKFGLACDNLVAAEVVTADGQVVRASDTENPHLLWGLRGGGGNFGVVTSYEFGLHQVGPTIVGGMLVHPIEQAGDVLRRYREYVDGAPDELATGFAFFPAPPEPFIPAGLRGRTVLGIIAAWCGDVDQGITVTGALKAIGSPAVDLVGPMPYVALQSLLDPTAPPGWRWYNTGEYLDDLGDDAIRTLVAHAPQGLAPLTQTIVFRHGGAVSRVPEADTAFANRQPAYLLHPLAAWLDPADEDRQLAWLRTLVRDMTPFTTGGVYLNFSPPGAERVVDGFGQAKLKRLAELKRRYDPTNVFRFNHNIRREPDGLSRPAR
jgi:FAD/FMN-containing dehydrogenase